MAEKKQAKTTTDSAASAISEEEKLKRERDKERNKSLPPALIYYIQTPKGTFRPRFVKPAQRLKEGI